MFLCVVCVDILSILGLTVLSCSQFYLIPNLQYSMPDPGQSRIVTPSDWLTVWYQRRHSPYFAVLYSTVIKSVAFELRHQADSDVSCNLQTNDALLERNLDLQQIDKLG